MKILRWLFALVMLIAATEAMAARHSVTTYYGIGNDEYGTVSYSLRIIMPSAVYDGEYRSTGVFSKGDYLQNTDWNGPPPAPTVQMTSFKKNVNKSLCPGLPAGWGCGSMTFEITVSASIEDQFYCPWLVAVSDKVQNRNGASYQGPTGYGTLCPTVSVQPYDVSWSESYVSKSKQLTLQSTGGVIEKTISTYLMKDGKLCDSSQMNETGGYCRWVAQMITFTASGCDKAEVKVTPNRHPITDKELHDMVVRVDTSSMQPIDSTCTFQYVLNEL
ncbi:DUF2544 domain-containing protein [Escherichia coli]|uniref:StfH/YfcO family fimbrial adhesin n=1 Tax=Escherichia sp. MOD1-EC7003 TaxID=2093900 RepID=UPI000CF7A6DF|nr:StfH/YfcO family fimbrial adhesin [Escherichia sp. MOD1-EC7003]EGO8361116.1 DUF2544 domain-containing protein [Escherichia coli]EGO8378612.1 DUF2544 domain-containing protein [Escherichia coli]MCH0695627.1 YfcO family protein [Escherichia coli]